VAASGGGTVYLPPIDRNKGECYRTLLPVQVRDNVTLKGAGFSSLVRNDRTTGDVFFGRACVLIGWFHENYWRGGAQDVITAGTYARADVSAGEDEVTLDPPSDAANFALGDLVAIRSAMALPGGEPYELAHREVVDIDTDAG